jgi:hypothetical protein
MHQTEHLPLALQNDAINLVIKAEALKDIAREEDPCKWELVMRRLSHEINVMRARGEELRVALAAQQMTVDRQPKSSSSRLHKLQVELESNLKSVRASIRKAVTSLSCVAISAAHLKASVDTGSWHSRAESLKSDIDDLREALWKVQGKPYPPDAATESKNTSVEELEEKASRQQNLGLDDPLFDAVGAQVYLRERIPQWLEVVKNRRPPTDASDLGIVVKQRELSRAAIVADDTTTQQVHRFDEVVHTPQKVDQVTRMDTLAIDQAIQINAITVDQATQMDTLAVDQALRVDQATQMCTVAVDQATQIDMQRIDQAAQVDIPASSSTSQSKGEIGDMVKFMIDFSAFAAIEQAIVQEGERKSNRY